MLNIKKLLTKILQWINNTIENNPTGYKEIWVGDITDRVKAGTSLTNTSGATEWVTELLKTLVSEYPGRTNKVFKGIIRPSSTAIFEIFIYDTSTSSNGLPRYSYGTWKQWTSANSGVPIVNYFGTNNYDIVHPSGAQISNTSQDMFYKATRTDKGTTVGMGVGEGGTNHGLYSYVMNKWLIYGTNTEGVSASNQKVYVNGLDFSSAAAARNAIDAQQELTTKTITINYTTTTGTTVSASCHQYGKIVQLRVNFRNTSSVASGANVLNTTFTSALPAPLTGSSSVTYYGAHALVGALSTGRNLTVRNAASSAIQMGSDNTATMNFTYICS